MPRLFLVVLSVVAIVAALPQGQIAGSGYSGATGSSDGGAAMGNGGLINILANNGGPGGKSTSGDVLGGDVLGKTKGPKKWQANKAPCYDCVPPRVQKVDNGLLDVIIGGNSGDHLIKRHE